jgi:hypothetical protein
MLTKQLHAPASLIRENNPIVGYFMTFSVSRLYSIDDNMINECGAAGGMRIGRGSRSTRGNPSPVTLCLPQIPLDLSLYRNRAAVMAWPLPPGVPYVGSCVSSEVGLNAMANGMPVQGIEPR